MKPGFHRVILWGGIVLLLLTMALGMWLLKDATPYGLGLRTDSAQYINGARNLLEGNGYTRTSGAGELKPITHFPPMFSSLIAMVSLSGLEVMRSARLLVILLFGAGILLFGLLVYRITRSPGFSIAGSFLFATSAVFLEVYAWVMSEPLYSLASTITVPSVRPLMIRLRTGKFWGEGDVPGANSVSSRPVLRIFSVNWRCSLG